MLNTTGFGLATNPSTTSAAAATAVVTTAELSTADSSGEKPATDTLFVAEPAWFNRATIDADTTTLLLKTP